MDLFALSGVLAVVALALQTLRGVPKAHVTGACGRLGTHLQQQLVGQGPAVHEITDAVCAHLAEREPERPLVVSVHGPPGVGKSLLHKLLAEALYNFTDGLHECPGRHCPAYKIVFGVDYTVGEAELQHARLREAISGHVIKYPSSLVVVEEFDKASCESRDLLRHLVVHGDSQTSSGMTRSIIILESNTGYLELHKLLQDASRDRDRIPSEQASRVLKDKVFAEALGHSCFSHVEGNRFVNAIGVFLPFYPLERPHIEQAAGLQLKWKERQLRAEGRLESLEWDNNVLSFLADKVFFEDGYAVEGASQLRMIVSRFVSRALRSFDDGILERSITHPRRGTRLRLGVAGSGDQLQATQAGLIEPVSL